MFTGRNDAWTMPHLSFNVSRVDTLKAVLDVDNSEFVTISELNTFSLSRPPGYRFVEFVYLSQAVLIIIAVFPSGLHTGQ